jgi:hypothetical protein
MALKFIEIPISPADLVEAVAGTLKEVTVNVSTFVNNVILKLGAYLAEVHLFGELGTASGANVVTKIHLQVSKESCATALLDFSNANLLWRKIIRGVSAGAAAEVHQAGSLKFPEGTGYGVHGGRSSRIDPSKPYLYVSIRGINQAAVVSAGGCLIIAYNDGT